MVRLRRTSPDQPGWTRKRAGRGFAYFDEYGDRLPEDDVERVRALVIQPAWEDVWVTPYDNGHLQAVGTDAAGRRQYLYHPDWRTRRDAEKFDRVLVFGEALMKARERVLLDLRGEGMPRERACACATRLLDIGYFRIGNDVYADTHGSFGLTTLQRRHVRKQGDAMSFCFVGKSGIEHQITIEDPATVEALEVMRKRRAPAEEELLAWKERGRWHDLDAGHVNEYVRSATGVDATAKDFRTWHATVIAAAALAEAGEPAAAKADSQRPVAPAMRELAEYLGNAPALARSSYVDPRVVDAYEEPRTIAHAVRRRAATPAERQPILERAVLRLLKDA